MNQQEVLFETRCLSSLAKVFSDEELNEPPFSKGSSLKNETYSFQVAYRNNGELLQHIKVKTETELMDCLSIRKVDLVPSELPCYHDPDEWILRSTPGLYPDPLVPINSEGITAFPHQWRSIWLTLDLHKNVQPGFYNIKVQLETELGIILGIESFTLEVLAHELPDQKLIHTEWFHSDCLAVHYEVDVFSEEYWRLVDKYIESASRHGVNMILTPLFTPPLDTAVGAERPTVQLVEVIKSGNTYQFKFDQLNKWINLCMSKGIKYIEFAHFFTQWGAKSAPKIMAKIDGSIQKIFGWETDAASEDYKNFLAQFFPELIRFIEEKQLENCVYFHVSDEPKLEQMDSYKLANEIVYKYLGKFPIIDALSDYEFYKKGIVRRPIPSNDHLDLFLENKIPNLWTYYCCLQTKKVANRFFNFPSARNRIIGYQLYKFNITGFLHWGYNFWFSRLSKHKINPFQNTDAGYGFPSGDAFLVYPGEDGPIESIRMEVLNEALQDLRALQLLETMIGREQTIQIVEKSLKVPLSFTDYPRNNEWIIEVREEINYNIVNNSSNKMKLLSSDGHGKEEANEDFGLKQFCTPLSSAKGNNPGEHRE